MPSDDIPTPRGKQPPAASAIPGPAASFDEFATFTKDDVRRDVEALVETDADIDPRAYLWGPTDAAIIVLPQEAMTEDVKLITFEGLLPWLIRERKPRLFASAVTVYARLPKSPCDLSDSEREAFKEGRDIPGCPPKDQWRRREEVLLFVLARDRQEVWQAPIIRPHQQPPVLGYWATLGHDEPWGGRLVTPIRDALTDEAVNGQS